MSLIDKNIISPNERLKRLLDQINVSNKQVCKDLGITERSFYRIIEPGATIKSEYLKVFYDKYGITPNEIILGIEGIVNYDTLNSDEVRYGKVHSNAQDVKSVRTFAHSDEYYYLPFYNVRASAGDGRLNDETEALPFAFRKYWVKNVLRRSAASLYLIKIEGDSMRPTLVHDDMIMICKDDTIPDDGVFLLRISEALKVKRLTLLPGAKVRVSSDNELFKSYSMPLSEIQIMGRVVWFGRNV